MGDSELLLNALRIELYVRLVLPTGTANECVCLNGFGFGGEMNSVRGEVIDV